MVPGAGPVTPVVYGPNCPPQPGDWLTIDRPCDGNCPGRCRWEQVTTTGAYDDDGCWLSWTIAPCSPPGYVDGYEGWPTWIEDCTTGFRPDLHEQAAQALSGDPWTLRPDADAALEEWRAALPARLATHRGTLR